jgi:hypothetical protein
LGIHHLAYILGCGLRQVNEDRHERHEQGKLPG